MMSQNKNPDEKTPAAAGKKKIHEEHEELEGKKYLVPMLRVGTHGLERSAFLRCAQTRRGARGTVPFSRRLNFFQYRILFRRENRDSPL